MIFDIDQLLSGPRGRRLCLETAQYGARHDDSPQAEAFRVALFSAADDLDPGRGTSAVSGGRAAPPSSPVEVARAIDRLPDRVPDARGLLLIVRMMVSLARYWQEPDGEDVVAATGELRPALRRIGRTLLDSPYAQWWTSGMDPDVQWTVTFDEDAEPPVPGTADAAELLTTWQQKMITEEERARRERPADLAAPISGEWWSRPPPEVTVTTRRLDDLGPVGLWLVEDELGWERASVAPTVVDLGRSPRCYEIDAPDAWVRLCHRYPLELTASRRHDWYRATGVDLRWVIPDWSSVAHDYDAVHLSVAGYLTTAGRPLQVAAGIGSVLAGWSPDETYWLNGRARQSGEVERWRCDDDGGWLPE